MGDRPAKASAPGRKASANPMIRCSSAPEMPLIMYSLMKRLEPMRDSTRGPKKYSASMLKKMCPNPLGSCRNMYVMMVQGRPTTCAGTNMNASVTQGWASWRTNTAMLAIRSRVTQGVIGQPNAGAGLPCETSSPFSGCVLFLIHVNRQKPWLKWEACGPVETPGQTTIVPAALGTPPVRGKGSAHLIVIVIAVNLFRADGADNG